MTKETYEAMLANTKIMVDKICDMQSAHQMRKETYDDLLDAYYRVIREFNILNEQLENQSKQLQALQLSYCNLAADPSGANEIGLVITPQDIALGFGWNCF